MRHSCRFQTEKRMPDYIGLLIATGRWCGPTTQAARKRKPGLRGARLVFWDSRSDEHRLENTMVRTMDFKTPYHVCDFSETRDML